MQPSHHTAHRPPTNGGSLPRTTWLQCGTWQRLAWAGVLVAGLWAAVWAAVQAGA